MNAIRRFQLPGVLALAAVLAAGVTAPALGEEWEISWSTFRSGGRSHGGGFTVSGSMGEPSGGPMTGGNFQTKSGFLPPLGAQGLLLQPGFPRGDVNRDGNVDAVDIQLVINVVLGIPINPRYVPDVTESGDVDARDIQKVINVVLGIE